ncbi:MAG: Type-1 restriction enzyme MjaXIP specificity protein [Candidatus Heimdallarchaeota archaeon LC_2]|nr:MAG: Type-1 restriction enzyme MjaXIP specificity protein [Candidatus Heimdallarchaeota archaeon LC_2]
MEEVFNFKIIPDLKKVSKYKWIGKIPKSWKVIRLRYLCTIETGTKDTQDREKDGKYPLFVRSQIIEKINSYTHNTEAVMTAGDGVGVGKVFHFYNGKFSAHQRVYIFKNFVHSVGKFIYYYLKVNLASEVLSSNAKSTVDSLRRRMLADFPIALPSVKDQEIIVKFVDKVQFKLDQIISKKQQIISLLEEKRQAIITHTVTKGLDPDVPMKDSGIEWLGEIPEHWQLLPLKRIASIMPSGVDKKSKDDEFPVELCNYIDVYYNEEILENLDFMKATASINEIQKFKLQKGDVIITKDSETPDDIAVPAYVPQDLDVICGYHLTLLRSNEHKIIGEFLFRSIQSNLVKQQYSSVAYGITRYMISIRGTGSVLLSIPPIEEQKQIVKYISAKVSIIELLKGKISKQIELLKEYKQALITNAVTGKIDVRDYDS